MNKKLMLVPLFFASFLLFGFTNSTHYNQLIENEMNYIANELNLLYQQDVFTEEYIDFSMNSKDNAIALTGVFKESMENFNNNELNTRLDELIKKIENSPIEEKVYFFDIENSYRKNYTLVDDDKLVDELEITKLEYNEFFETEQIEGLKVIIDKIKQEEFDTNVLEQELALYGVLDLPTISIIGGDNEFKYEFYDIEEYENIQKDDLNITEMSGCTGSSCYNYYRKDVTHEELKHARRISYSGNVFSRHKYRESEEKLSIRVKQEKEFYYVWRTENVRVVKVTWVTTCRNIWFVGRVCTSTPRTTWGWGSTRVRYQEYRWVKHSEENIWTHNKTLETYDLAFDGRQNIYSAIAMDNLDDILENELGLNTNLSNFKGIMDLVKYVEYLNIKKHVYCATNAVASNIFDYFSKNGESSVDTIKAYLELLSTLVCTNVYNSGVISRDVVNGWLYKDIIISKNAHYNRNYYQEEFFEEEQTSNDLDLAFNNSEKPEVDSIVKINGINFYRISDTKSYFHQIGSENRDNIKLVSEYGFLEVVIDSDGNIITDDLVYGTYNYFGSEKSINGGKVSLFVYYVEHMQYDVLPYILWGNSVKDPSKISNRVLWLFDSIL